MRLRDGSIEDIHQEVIYVLSQRTGIVARMLRWAVPRLYRMACWCGLTILRADAAGRL